MANLDLDHLSKLKEGAESWNQWREENPAVVVPDLRQADLRGADLGKANLHGANLSLVDLGFADLTGTNLSGADLSEANLHRAKLTGAYLSQAKLTVAYLTSAILREADLTGADLTGTDLRGADLTGAILIRAVLNNAHLHRANLTGAYLSQAKLRGADLRMANLTRANLSRVDLCFADLSQANLSGADLSAASLIQTNFEDTTLTAARVYGISAWDLKLTGAIQRELIITPADAPSTITLDDLEVAQFIYLLLNNDRLRKVINTITSKVVLILGRFSPERKAVLNALREELRKRDHLPVLFDFEQPHQTTDETISTLAGMARFVIADLTDAKSVLQELRNLVPNRPSLPIQPILLAGQEEPGMFDFFRRFPWVLETQYYETAAELLANLGERVIEPAERKLAAGKTG